MTPLEVATEIRDHLQAIEALEAETMELVDQYGQGPTNRMKSFFVHIRTAHAAAEQAAKQIPEIAPTFGGK